MKMKRISNHWARQYNVGPSSLCSTWDPTLSGKEYGTNNTIVTTPQKLYLVVR